MIISYKLADTLIFFGQIQGNEERKCWTKFSKSERQMLEGHRMVTVLVFNHLKIESAFDPII